MSLGVPTGKQTSFAFAGRLKVVMQKLNMDNTSYCLEDKSPPELGAGSQHEMRHFRCVLKAIYL